MLKRLLLVTSNFGGGTGTHVAGMLGHVAPDRWDVEIVCHGSVDATLPDHVKVREVGPGWRMDRFPVSQLRHLRLLVRHVRSSRPDVVHTYFFWPIIYGRLLKRIGLIRNLVENREDEGFGMTSWEYRILRATSRLPDQVICVSEAVRRTVTDREGLPEEGTVVVRNGVTLPRERIDPDDRRALRTELGFSRDHLIVGMVANLNRAVKGGEYFVESMPLILAKVPRARFLIVGGGSSLEWLATRARELGVHGKVFFAGFRPDIERFYPLMDVSVLTSLSEGLSITLLESMSFGLPVVATRVGGNPEVVRHGHTGFLVPARDPQAFAEKVVELLRNRELRRAMGRRSRSVIEAEFALPRVAGRYQEIYDEVVEGSRA